MKTKPHYDFYTALNQRIIDAAIAGLSFYIAYQLRFDWQVPPEYAYQMWLFLPLVMVGQILFSSLLGVYRLIWRYISLTDALTVVRASVAFSLFFLLTYYFAMPSRWGLFRVPRSVIAIHFLLVLTLALSVRVLRRILYQRRSSAVPTPGKGIESRVLLIGAGNAGVRVTKEIAFRPDLKVVGFLDDDPKKIGLVINGVRVLGPIEAVSTTVREHLVDKVIICIARPPRAVLKRLWALCDPLPVQIEIIPTLEEILHDKANIASFRDIQMADLLGRETVELSSNAAELAVAYSGKCILITGAGGSIGSELTEQLLRLRPAQMILLDKDENGIYELYSRLGVDPERPPVHPVIADIRFPERLKVIFRRFRPEVVFHAAAHKHVPLMEMNPCEAIINNVIGTKNLVEQCLASGVSQFILISTDKAVKPTSIMGASKRICEMIVQAQCNHGGTRFCCVRFGNVVGSRGSVIPLFQLQIARGGPVTVTHAEVQRFLMTIPEAVSLVIKAGTLGCSGETYVLDMGDPVPILDLARDLIELSGLRPDKDIQIELTQLRPGEKMREELIDSGIETLSRTTFEKIFVVRTQPIDSAALAQALARLEAAARRESPQEIYDIFHELNIGSRFHGVRESA